MCDFLVGYSWLLPRSRLQVAKELELEVGLPEQFLRP